jgi:tetratricopeptide (TPR) repeat protein
MSSIADPLRQAGLNALKAGRLPEAVQSLLKAAQLDPESFDTYTFLGASYSRMADYESARRAFGRAIQLDPSSARAWYNLGVAHQMAGDDDSARTCFQNAIDRDPAHLQAAEALQKLKPKPMSMAELASVGGSVRLAGAHTDELQDHAPQQTAHVLTPQELAKLAMPEGGFHMPGAQAGGLKEADAPPTTKEQEKDA